MGKIDHVTKPDLYRSVTVGNLRRQFDLLRDLVTVGLTCDFKVNIHIIRSLHNTVATHLVEEPGSYRTDAAFITNSLHTPPAHEQVKDLMLEYVVEIHKRWNSTNDFMLAAYVLWRLLWIHPFEDGNGRTARALAYLVICLKQGQWLPGEQNLMIKIKESSEEYTQALRFADTNDKANDENLIPLALYLAKLTQEQINRTSRKHHQSPI